MNNKITSYHLAFRIWFFTALFFTLALVISTFIKSGLPEFFIPFLILLVSLIGSAPVLFLLFVIFPIIKKSNFSLVNQFILLFIICFCLIIPYSLIGAFFDFLDTLFNMILNFVENLFFIQTLLFTSNIIAIIFSNKIISNYFLNLKHNKMQDNTSEFISGQNEKISNNDWQTQNYKQSQSNKILIKALITGAIILLMLIPTLFVSNLVKERELRQKTVVQEVSNKWANAQTISGPYIYIPYNASGQDDNGKSIIISKKLLLLPEQLNVNANITPEVRPRSIYKVYLYKSNINATGNFQIKIPTDVNVNDLQLNNAKICFNVSDLKGIEEKITLNFNGSNYELSPGLPFKELKSNYTDASIYNVERVATATSTSSDMIGLSANINLTAANFSQTLNFDITAKINGSEQLHFIPLAGNSIFNLKSNWPNPKFDGNKVPNKREVTDSGFTATWNYNKANLLFSTAINDFNTIKANYDFGVSLLQPADQYAKTDRCIKYAILIIGLTLGLFFIIEIFQKKPIHPVQYILLGIALIVFFTLLLSISEFVLFDIAYLIAAIATISLITMFAYSHFKSFKVASIFGLILISLYSFIFILIRLEDTALIIGSIGLFIILAIVMWGSKKIDWYGKETV